MRVISLDTVAFSVPLDDSATTKSHPLGIPSLSYVLVRARADDGSEGWGEMSDGWGYEYPAVADALVTEAIGRFVVGQDPRDADVIAARIWAWMRRRQGRRWLVAQAVSGVDLALRDLAAQAEGIPLNLAAGTPVRDRIPVYFGGNFLGQAPAAMHAESFRAPLERGVRGIKVRIGTAWEEHLDILAELIDLLGPGIEVGVDGNEAFKVETAARIAARMGDLGVAFFEEPVPRDRSGLAEMVAASPVAIAYGEHVHRASGFRALEDDGPLADIWQPDVTVVGGLGEAVATFALADELGREISPHSATTPLGLAANLHAASLAPTLSRVEYSATAVARLAPLFHGGEWVAPDAVSDGSLPVPAGPGLGIVPDVAALVGTYPLLDPTRIEDFPAFYTGSV